MYLLSVCTCESVCAGCRNFFEHSEDLIGRAKQNSTQMDDIDPLPICNGVFKSRDSDEEYLEKIGM